MNEKDIVPGTFWARQGNNNAMKVLAVADGFVMYRHRKHHAGAITVEEWLRDMRLMGRQGNSTPTPTVARVRRAR